MDSLSSSGAGNYDMKDLANELKVETGQNEEEELGQTWIPLEMESIVEKILGYLDLDSLKCARQVNKLWNCEGIKILFKSFFIKMPSKVHFNENGDKWNEEFGTFLSYNSFKIPHLIIQHEKDVNILISMKVFEENIKAVKSLRWNLYPFKSGGVLQELLSKLPNLNYLGTYPNICRGLKKIIINFCTDTKTRLTQKPLVISDFVLSAERDDLNVFGELEKFSKCEGVMIKNLWVSDFSGLNSHRLQNQFISMINNVLHSSQNVLTRLNLNSSELYLSQLHFPTMPNLTELNWYFDRKRYPNLDLSYGLNPSFKFAEMTPNIKEFALHWQGAPDQRQEVELWTNFFDSTGPAPSVKELTYSDDCASYNIDQVLRVFPNLQEFWHLDVMNFESVVTSIWKFGLNIKKLKLEINLPQDGTEMSSFDRIFTGFSQETVDLIQNSETGVIPNAENLRVNPSILDLKGLEICDFDFDGGPCDSSMPRRILEVAGDYAFKLMPNVKIEISTTLCNATAEAIRAASKKVCQLRNVRMVYSE